MIGKGIELNKAGTDTPLMMETRSACPALPCPALPCPAQSHIVGMPSVYMLQVQPSKVMVQWPWGILYKSLGSRLRVYDCVNPKV